MSAAEVLAPDRPRLQLLSGFALRRGDRELVLQPASERVVAYLALADKAVERGSAAYRLWPDTPEPRAVANLRTALWRIRRLSADLIEATATHVRLHPAVWVDARHGLEELRSRGAAGLRDGAEGLALQGDLLPDWYDDWLMAERERLRQLRLHALEDTVHQLIDHGQLSAAIDLGLRAVALEPLRESAHRLVIRAHLQEGNRAEAVRQYEACARLLRDELGVEPSPQMTALLAAPG